MVGKTFSEGMERRELSYSKGDDPILDDMFGDVLVSSVVCVPLATTKKTLGCVQFINTSNKGNISDEEADIIGIMTTMISMAIDDNEKLHTDKELKEVLISARGIEKTYSNGIVETKVLKGVDLDIYKGEFVVILGESGCGKSTFLNIISGMTKMTGGEFSFLGKDLTNASEEELTLFRRENVGFIFQSYNLMPNLTVKQNLDLIAELVDKPMDSVEALKIVGLTERMDNFPSQLSGGQQQRVSIARALVKNPVLVFADEPTAALDYSTSIDVLTALENSIMNGTTLVMITHNEEIAKMANRVVRMRNGRVYEVVVNRKIAKAVDLVW